ncbi:unnamed protein product [Dibothriocephalus latus]|uniref:Uncharacterized protein n=1 Tax=Dibothriocephalus latus TaxID=60516 RepID=A0A3P6Q3E5_DIBLA|nr:unnamed protein product [Dibothriocephalus latus]
MPSYIHLRRIIRVCQVGQQYIRSCFVRPRLADSATLIYQLQNIRRNMILTCRRASATRLLLVCICGFVKRQKLVCTQTLVYPRLARLAVLL